MSGKAAADVMPAAVSETSWTGGGFAQAMSG